MKDPYRLAEEKAERTYETVLLLAQGVKSAEAMGDSRALDIKKALLDFSLTMIDKLYELTRLPQGTKP